MDKNTIIGFVLIFVVLFGFTWLNQPSAEQQEAQRRHQDSIAVVQRTQQNLELQASQKKEITRDSLSNTVLSDSMQQLKLEQTYGDFSIATKGEEKWFTLENELLEIKLSTKGGRIYSARLKNYTSYDSLPLVLFNADEAAFGLTLITMNNRVVNTGDLYFEPVQSENNQVTMRLKAGLEGSLDFKYSLAPNDYMLRFEIVPKKMESCLVAGTNSVDLQWMQKTCQQETGRKFEERYAHFMYKFNADGVEEMKSSNDDSKNLPDKLKWIACKDQFFSSVIIADEDFEASKLDFKYFHDSKYIGQSTVTTSIAFDPKGEKSSGFHFFFGPNQYSLLKKYDKTHFKDQNLELEKLVPLGWSLFRTINKWIVIPLFDYWAKICGNIGIAILLLTLTIKLLLFPLTNKSFMSSAKMRVMRPQVEEITEKYPGQDNAMLRQQKTMELYRQVGVNPMSGCLPMLLQMPFFIALFSFFPSAIELRHESFLWAKDLSTYDAVISWNTYVPLVSPYFGNHISLFCLLMTIINIIYTKFNMDQTNTGQQQMPGMKIMMYSGPVFMLIFFNSYSSGLSYYYFVSTALTILQAIAFRYFVNEEKLLAKLEANKKKPPKKKSGFMAKLEEAQRQQQTAAKQRTAQQAKGKK